MFNDFNEDDIENCLISSRIIFGPKIWHSLQKTKTYLNLKMALKVHQKLATLSSKSPR